MNDPVLLESSGITALENRIRELGSHQIDWQQRLLPSSSLHPICDSGCRSIATSAISRSTPGMPGQLSCWCSLTSANALIAQLTPPLEQP